jgi:hypothetical protein
MSKGIDNYEQNNQAQSPIRIVTKGISKSRQFTGTFWASVNFPCVSGERPQCSIER